MTWNEHEADGGLEAVPERAAEAAAALAALKGPAEDAGRAIEQAFARAGDSLATSLTRAAADGRITLDELAAAAIRAFGVLARGGFAKGGGSLGEALAAAACGAFSGARAGGGPVVGGGAYLVGERGPEVFRPAGAGEVAPLGSGPVSVRVEVVGGDAAGLLRSEAQIAQALARAVSLGARRL